MNGSYWLENLNETIEVWLQTDEFETGHGFRIIYEIIPASEEGLYEAKSELNVSSGSETLTDVCMKTANIWLSTEHV